MPVDPILKSIGCDPFAATNTIYARALTARRTKTRFRLPELIPTLYRMAAQAKTLAMRASAVGIDPGHFRVLQTEIRHLIEECAPYPEVVLTAARFVMATDYVVRHTTPGLPETFMKKAHAELAQLLKLWPYVLVLPTFSTVSIDYFLRIRPVPLHILGLVCTPTYADGQLCSPAEFFFHDVDHARFKVREDLLALGYEIPDPYIKISADEPASTYDAVSGMHRTILDQVVPVIDDAGARLWERAPARIGWMLTLLRKLESLTLRDADLGVSARFLLFEILHEKGFPAHPRVLLTQLGSTAHIRKLQWKVDTDFWKPSNPSPAAARRANEASAWLSNYLEAIWEPG